MNRASTDGASASTRIKPPSHEAEPAYASTVTCEPAIARRTWLERAATQVVKSDWIFGYDGPVAPSKSILTPSSPLLLAAAMRLLMAAWPTDWLLTTELMVLSSKQIATRTTRSPEAWAVFTIAANAALLKALIPASLFKPPDAFTLSPK